ncbi:MAG: trimethylamine methyltransferase family protein [Desulfobacterales bacterium]|nr:MAG: trimethylamine methyltransferase family protein [Desulfobacterales bacterium]
MKRNLHAGKRQSGGLSLKLFTDDELEEIHLATLEVLEKTGLLFDDEEALDILAGSGAIIDKKTRIAKFPPYLVEDAIRSAPSKLLLAGRNPKHDFVMESNRVGFTNFGEGVFIIDPYTGEHRETTKADVAASALIADYLSEIDVYERAVGAGDVPQDTVQLHNAEAWLPNTSKHGFMGPGNGYLLKKIVEMASAIVGGTDTLLERPIISFITCPVSPLQLVKESCEIIMESARTGLACNVLSMAMAGGSSPVTLAGTLVDHNAEILGGLVLSQLTRKGAKFIYGSSTTAMDLRLAAASVGSPECALINAAVAQMATYYLLPSWVAGG